MAVSGWKEAELAGQLASGPGGKGDGDKRGLEGTRTRGPEDWRRERDTEGQDQGKERQEIVDRLIR